MYKVRYYEEQNGRKPIREFILSSSESLQAKIIRQLKYLEIYGLTKENLNLKNLSGTPLWEIRILGKDNVRIICIAMVNNEVFVLHIFKKKTNKTSTRELNLAMRRYKNT